MASRAHLHSHVLDHHGISSEKLEDVESSSLHTNDTFMAHDCPFCDDWAANIWSRQNPKGKVTSREGPPPPVRVSARRFKRHVGRHHEHLATFAMPRHLDEGTGGSDNSSSCGSVAVEHGDIDTEGQHLFADHLFKDLHGPAPRAGWLQSDQSSDVDRVSDHTEMPESLDLDSETSWLGRKIVSYIERNQAEGVDETPSDRHGRMIELKFLLSKAQADTPTLRCSEEMKSKLMAEMQRAASLIDNWEALKMPEDT